MKERKAAVALGYNPAQDAAPKVLAAGQGEIAKVILQQAEAHGVPIHTDHPLAQALVRLQVGSQIPPELYRAVAEVLAFLYKLESEVTE